jgi:hypothetical protein
MIHLRQFSAMPQSLHTPQNAIVVTIALVLVIAPTSTHGDEQAIHLGDSILQPSDVGVTVASNPMPSDRLWLINTRHLTTNVFRANLEQPSLSVFRVNRCDRLSRTKFEDYITSIGENRSVVVYVHGNRLNADEAIERGISVYCRTRQYRRCGPVDWVIWSWPTERSGTLLRDARRKMSRTDSQGMYLSWVLRRHAEDDIDTSVIGYSFGARVISGALHALAGGKLGGRLFPGSPLTGMRYNTGFVAPAIECKSLSDHGEHSLATKNMGRLMLLYNRRDIVLKRFWLLDRVRGHLAMGYTGPHSFALRADGSKLPVRSRDCSSSLGIRHDELRYYKVSCGAGAEMAALINDNNASK